MIWHSLASRNKMKLRWFVCLLEDTACMLQYIGSTTDVCSSRWSSTKSARNKEDSVCTGMYKHFKQGWDTWTCSKDKTTFFHLFPFTVVINTMVFILDGCSFHVAHVWCKQGLFRKKNWWLFRCNQMPSTNRNAWFTPCVRTVKWATI